MSFYHYVEHTENDNESGLGNKIGLWFKQAAIWAVELLNKKDLSNRFLFFSFDLNFSSLELAFKDGVFNERDENLG